MKTGMRHDEYVKTILEKREKETRNIDLIHETGDKFSSPPGATSLEENKLLTEYMDQINLQKIANALPEYKKPLLLKKFFKMKRNQQVIVYLSYQGEMIVKTGKVTAIGRDFVMLNNLITKIWIPYHEIISANTPAGVPNYTNSHQYFIYDNDLKNKLLYSFGETVSKRDALIQQFYEESLYTNLNSWKGMWVKLETNTGSYSGKIDHASDKTLVLKGNSTKIEIELIEISHIYSLRFFEIWSLLIRRLKRKFLF